MKVPWPDDRCILCSGRSPLTEEHLIPEAIGGALTCEFLCKPCNDQLGSLEARFKEDPAVRLAIENLKGDIPQLWRAMSERQPFVVGSSRGPVRARLMHGRIRVDPSKEPDGSLIRATEDVPEVIRTKLRRRGFEESAIEEALRRFEEATEDTRVPIADGFEIVKWTVSDVRPALDGRLLVAPIIPVKIAYEYLALHVGSLIFNSRLDPIRDALRSRGPLPGTCSVEELQAFRHAPFHGLIVERKFRQAVVLIRLFGNLAYRVRFQNIGLVNSPFIAYTLRLDTGDEDLVET